MRSELIEALGAVCGPEAVLVGAAIPDRNLADAAGLAPARPVALVRPRTVEAVSAVLACCHARGQPVVVQGGMTGLVGGAHPDAGEVALSLERLVGIEEVDRESGTLTALAGTPLQAVQEAAAAADLLCGIDLGARGTCTIGGNVATNAGGNQVLRYGMTRRSVLALEVVLADGRIVRSTNKMLKNNAGYDWTQLLVGSEGTLGVVTRVTISLQPRPRSIETAVVAVESTADAIRLLRDLERRLPAGLLVFEAMWREFYAIATGRMGRRAPLAQGRDVYLLIEAPGGEGEEPLAAALAEAQAAGLVADAVLARSGRDRADFWALRESVYEHKRHFPPGVGFDVAIPLARMAEAVEGWRRDAAAALGDAVWVVFGHLADANIHINVMPPVLGEPERRAIEQLVYGLCGRFGGSISAEHGIGRTKRAYLHLTRSPEELAVMAAMKQALDPKGILNRGRVLP